MKLVIDIDENLYKELKKYYDADNYGLLSEFAIANGTPLPKGHGRLIDADAYIDKHENFGWLDDIAVNEFNAITPTIVEADKEGNEK